MDKTFGGTYDCSKSVTIISHYKCCLYFKQFSKRKKDWWSQIICGNIIFEIL